MNPVALQFKFMALAVDVLHRCGPIKEMCHQLKQQKTFYPLFITKKTNCFEWVCHKGGEWQNWLAFTAKKTTVKPYYPFIQQQKAF